MPGKDDFQIRNAPRGGRYNGVVAGDMGMHDIERFFLEARSQPEGCPEIRGIHEREFDVRIEEALAAAGDENFVPACSKGFDQAQDVSFAPAAIAR